MANFISTESNDWLNRLKLIIVKSSNQTNTLHKA